VVKVNVYCVNYQFYLDPTTDSMLSTYPIWQRRQAAGMIGQPAKATFNGIAKAMQGLAELGLQQGHGAHASSTVPAMPQAGIGPLSFSYQLKTALQGHFVQGITVILFVPKDISAPLQSREHSRRYLRFAFIQWRDRPTQGQGSGAIYSMQLVTFGITPGACSPPFAVVIFAMRTNDQRFAVHDRDPSLVVLKLYQRLFYNIQQPLDFRRPQPIAHRGLRRQFSPWPQAFGPIFRVTCPDCRSIVEYRPHVNHHDFPVKESPQVSTAPICQNAAQSDITLSRVRVPFLVSFRLGTIRQECTRTRFFSSITYVPLTNAS
jgi:hypothetical protein